ncbi:hypothetical protein [Saccharothrix sp. Mg75]|uniref:hypothetical protein n=1 Tax=Saccharothrix sp. Mg75 TaxID=3445357 RepID=UPI003EEFA41D
MSRRKNAVAALTVFGAVLLIIGAVIPWAGGPGVDDPTVGFGPRTGRNPTVGDRYHLAGGDALTAAVAGIAVAVVAFVLIRYRARPVHRNVLIGAALFAGAWALLDINSIGAEPGIDVHVTVGPFIALVGAGSTLAAALLVVPDHARDLALRTDRALRLWARSRQFESLARQQENVRRAERVLGDHPTTASAMLLLAESYLLASQPGRAAVLIDAAEAGAAAWAARYPTDHMTLVDYAGRLRSGRF